MASVPFSGPATLSTSAYEMRDVLLGQNRREQDTAAALKLARALPNEAEAVWLLETCEGEVCICCLSVFHCLLILLE
jgi:hypothetical protein